MLTKAMGEPMYGLLLSSRPGVRGLFSMFEGFSLDALGCRAVTHRKYFLCESHSQQALKGSVLLRDCKPNLAMAFLR